ncbi:MAG: hypothetical protein ABI366_01820 [Ginsengibacter sp.]
MKQQERCIDTSNHLDGGQWKAAMIPTGLANGTSGFTWDNINFLRTGGFGDSY